MQEIIEKEKIKIENMIYDVRGKQVMIDSDVANLFGYETKYLNRQVQRNKNKFPENYSFQLTDVEYNSLRCQNVTLKNARGEHRKYLPYVFTEYGITMLAGILKSEVAVKMSLKIVDTFITMRKYISSNLLEQKYINNQVIKNTEDIKVLQQTFEKFKPNNNHIFFEGQIYDAYSLLLDILESSEKNIVIIDNYADKKLLDLLSKTEKKVKVYSKNMNDELIKKYKEQYKNIEIIENHSFHDRFIIIDNKELYHCGSSFKELGKKCFAINKINDESLVNKLIEALNNINSEL